MSLSHRLQRLEKILRVILRTRHTDAASVQANPLDDGVGDTFGSVSATSVVQTSVSINAFGRHAHPRAAHRLPPALRLAFQQTRLTYNDGKSTSAPVVRQSGTGKMLSSVQLFSGNRFRLAADRHQGMMDVLPRSGAFSCHGVPSRRNQNPL